MSLDRIVTGDKGRIAQLMPGAGNNQQARASDVNPIIDVVNDLSTSVAALEAANLTPTTAPASITDSSGGTAGSAPFTIAAITQVANAGSADTAPVANAIAKLAADIALIRTALITSGILL